MNDLDLVSNSARPGQQHPKSDEQQPTQATAVGEPFLGAESRLQRPSWRIIGGAVIAFWLFWYAAYTAYVYINTPNDAVETLLPRSLIAASGVAISLAIAAAFDALRRYQLSIRALAGVPLSLVGTGIHSVITLWIWSQFMPMPIRYVASSPLWLVYATDFIVRFWFFAAQSGIILALSYAADVREREQRISRLQALAHSAQLRALRYQLNPHFLFNALNSIAGLLSSNRVNEAEAMTENLADFLRTTLALDPQKLITLDEEVQLQTLYLDVEKLRFPERLRVEIDVPADVRSALVPSLIAQPLVENSIKYSVARSTEAVDLRIAARSVGDRLELTIEDSGSNTTAAPAKGARTGLSNVRERLLAHYGDNANFTAKPTGHGFRNVITIPLRSA